MPSKNLVLKQRGIIYLLTVVFLMYAAAVIYKYYDLGYRDWDLAYFSQGMWNLKQGSLYVSVTGIRFFADHAQLIAYLVLPFYALASHPLFLLLSKVVFFILSGYVFYLLTVEHVPTRWALCWTVIYLFYPANIFAMLYEFTFESYACFFLLLMVLFFQRDQFRAFVITSILACLVKENIPLILVMFGVYSLWAKPGQWKWFVYSFFVGLVSFLFFVQFLIPLMRQTPVHVFWLRYEHLGHSPREVVAALFNLPKIIPYIFSPINKAYLLDLFGPLVGFMIISPAWMFMVLPILLQHLLSGHWPEHTIYYHYGMTLMPFIAYAAFKGFVLLRNKGRRKWMFFLTGMMTLAALFYPIGFSKDICAALDTHRDGLSQERWAMVRSIPDDAGVVATFDFLAPLSMRKDLYAFHKVYHDYFQDKRLLNRTGLNMGHPFVLPANVHYALIDHADPWLRDALSRNPKVISKRVRDFLKEWRPIKRVGRIILYRR